MVTPDQLETIRDEISIAYDAWAAACECGCDGCAELAHALQLLEDVLNPDKGEPFALTLDQLATIRRVERGQS